MNSWSSMVPAESGYYTVRFVPDGEEVIAFVGFDANGVRIYLPGSDDEQDPEAFEFMHTRHYAPPGAEP